MEVKEFVQRQIAAAHRLTDGVVQDTTDEQLNWMPPGTANPIATTLVHLIVSEDSFVQRVLQGKPLLWEAGGWGQQIGLSAPPGRQHGWDEIKSARLSLAPILGYQAAVRAAIDAYLAGLTPDELDREVEAIGAKRPVADVLALLVTHVAGHAGDIAAIKGVQGVKGLPF
jgi:hypothetical protein